MRAEPGASREEHEPGCVNPRYRKGTKVNRPGRTKAVVSTHGTAGQGATSVRTRGEPRPKGPTITPQTEARDSNAGHDVCAKERQQRHQSSPTVLTKLARIAEQSKCHPAM